MRDMTVKVTGRFVKLAIGSGMALALTLLAYSSPANAEEGSSWKVVNYWSEWCAPCRIEIPMLNQLSAKLAVNGIAVVGINFDDDPREKTLEIARELDIRFPVLTMNEVEELALRPPDVLPTTYIITPENTVAAKLIGEQTEEEILASLLSFGLSVTGQ